MKNKISREYRDQMAGDAMESIRTVIDRYKEQVKNETGVFINDYDFLIRTDLLDLKKINEDSYCIDYERILNMPPDDIWQLMIEFAVDKKRIGKKRINEIESSKTKNIKLSAPVIALFCSLVNESGLILKGFENNESYCKIICNKFSLPYTDKVRQNFGQKRTAQNTEKVKKIILPTIDERDSQQIIKHLEKPKLYG